MPLNIKHVVIKLIIYDRGATVVEIKEIIYCLLQYRHVN